ncbi:MAG: DUF5682 family protein, partial [Lachnospiraceae bacterium]|nr:DUF5682 family protein [Lachnospiraceae bacterium]
MKAEIRAGRPYVFGIRHLSPAGAWYLRQVLDERKPELILVEGPSDFNELMEELASPEVQPPFAVMAYTKALPVRTILYPFAVYSPEYQAIRWAAEHHCPCRFCDLPSEVFLGLEEAREKRRADKEPLGNETPQSGPLEEENPNAFVYRSLDKLSEDGSHETFWERTMEHAADWEGYQRGAAEFGRSLRSLTLGNSVEDAENLVREAYMSRVIQDAAAEGVPVEKILVVTGAYHVDGILR